MGLIQVSKNVFALVAVAITMAACQGDKGNNNGNNNPVIASVPAPAAACFQTYPQNDNRWAPYTGINPYRWDRHTNRGGWRQPPPHRRGGPFRHRSVISARYEEDEGNRLRRGSYKPEYSEDEESPNEDPSEEQDPIEDGQEYDPADKPARKPGPGQQQPPPIMNNNPQYPQQPMPQYPQQPQQPLQMCGCQQNFIPACGQQGLACVPVNNQMQYAMWPTYQGNQFGPMTMGPYTQSSCQTQVAQLCAPIGQVMGNLICRPVYGQGGQYGIWSNQ